MHKDGELTVCIQQWGERQKDAGLLSEPCGLLLDHTWSNSFQLFEHSMLICNYLFKVPHLSDNHHFLSTCTGRNLTVFLNIVCSLTSMSSPSPNPVKYLLNLSGIHQFLSISTVITQVLGLISSWLDCYNNCLQTDLSAEIWSPY